MSIKEDFYNNLSSVLSSVRKGDIVIILGDFNAQVGNDNTSLQDVMGVHGIGRITENGRMLTEMCATNNLVIGGTLLPHKYIHKVTWVSPDSHTENQIHHILISKKWRGSLLDVKNKRGADIGSDHYLILTTLRLKVAAVKRENKQTRRHNISQLKVAEVANAYIDALKSAERNNRGESRDHWPGIKNIFITAANNHIGYIKTNRKEWISDETWNLIQQRKAAKAAINTARTRSAKLDSQRKHNLLNRMVKRSARCDKRRRIENIAKEAQAASETYCSRGLYKTVKQLANRPSTTSKPIRDENGSLASSSNDQLKVWENFYKTLLSNTDTLITIASGRNAPP
ncbi:uncharacterized protein LOC128861771 [Anastrepha ludens]|uniref:uncharacterized protein LOC128861771 n=1 Tax=Anastrepha ludens TaxID=28586 RepID=UPI0023AF5722|nr:uncharacterized protein LOC128861771 [Anastrepha ludens]